MYLGLPSVSGAVLAGKWRAKRKKGKEEKERERKKKEKKEEVERARRKKWRRERGENMDISVSLFIVLEYLITMMGGKRVRPGLCEKFAGSEEVDRR